MRVLTAGITALLLTTLSACGDLESPVQPGEEIPDASQALVEGKAKGQESIVILKGSAGIPHLVRLKDPAGRSLEAARSMVVPVGGRVEHVFKHVFDGYFVSLPNSRAAEAIRNLPNVEYVVADTGRNSDHGDQLSPPWALNRVDQRFLPLDNDYFYFGTGSGVHVFVVDSGIDRYHPELSGKIAPEYHFSGRAPYDPFGTCNPHGTMVSSVIAGETLGVAKNTILHSMQVSDCNGDSGGQAIPTMAIDFAVDWALNHGQWPAVINYSRGHDPWWWPFSNPIEDAVKAAVNAGVPVVVSAGNDSGDACDDTPARVGKAITVAATTSSDAVASWSNSGGCVDILAPGNLVQVAYPGGGYTPANGTSFSAPAVTGALALVWSDPAVYWGMAWNVLKWGATEGVLSSLRGAPNLLLNTLYTQVSLQGLDEVDMEGNYIWTANARGGNRTFQYQWLIQFEGQEWEYLIGETSPSVSRFVSAGEPDFSLRVLATSFGEQVVDQVDVDNRICEPGGEGGEECNW